MILVSPTLDWTSQYSGSSIGILEVSGVDNSGVSTTLDARKRVVEESLRREYAGCSRTELLENPTLQAYQSYYRRFDKTYHVQLQLESVAMKGKNFPNVSPLVDANFVAELETLVLTAGHDVAKLRAPLSIDVSRTGDIITQMNGVTKEMRPGDMLMRDEGGICCSIIYGQDNRSPISAVTSHVLYVAYAPLGVGHAVVEDQLRRIEGNIRLFNSDCIVEQLAVLAT